MMRPRWILERHPDLPSVEHLSAYLRGPVVLERDDIVRGRWPELSGPAVAYGTMFTMTRMLRQPGLSQAVFDDYALLKCSAYYRWVYDLLGRHCFLVPMTALQQLPLERMLGSQIFLRSDSNYKLFPAQVHPVAELDHWIERYQQYVHELVVVSETIPFASEYRCFCRQGRFVCGSSYPDPPYQDVPSEVRRFAEAVAGRMLQQGAAMLSVDVGVSPDGRLRLVELGGVNSWGLYGSDPERFIAAMEAETLSQLE